jgi:hypothetical protein
LIVKEEKAIQKRRMKLGLRMRNESRDGEDEGREEKKDGICGMTE